MWKLYITLFTYKASGTIISHQIQVFFWKLITNFFNVFYLLFFKVPIPILEQKLNLFIFVRRYSHLLRIFLKQFLINCINIFLSYNCSTLVSFFLRIDITLLWSYAILYILREDRKQRLTIKLKPCSIFFALNSRFIESFSFSFLFKSNQTKF